MRDIWQLLEKSLGGISGSLKSWNNHLRWIHALDRRGVYSRHFINSMLFKDR